MWSDIVDNPLNEDPLLTPFRFSTVPYHGIMKTEIESDDKQLYHLFRKYGMEENEALTALQEIRTMAGQNILAKMDAQTAELQAQSAELRAQGAEQSKSLQAQVASQTADSKELNANVQNLYRTIGILVAAFGVAGLLLQIVIQLSGD